MDIYGLEALSPRCIYDAHFYTALTFPIWEGFVAGRGDAEPAAIIARNTDNHFRWGLLEVLIRSTSLKLSAGYREGKNNDHETRLMYRSFVREWIGGALRLCYSS